MGEDFDSQSRHVIDAAVGLRGVPVMTSAAGSFLGSGDTIDLSNLGHILGKEAGGGLSWAQRHPWKRGDAVYVVINFIRLDI